MKKNKLLTASLEDYLETIYHIIEDKQAARVKEIAKRLEVNNSSVTGALKSLAKKGYLNYAPYDVITLTEEGEKMALDVIRRHEILKKFIIEILCIEDEEKADDAACIMEHAVTPEVLERIIRFVEFTRICPRSGTEWTQGFKRFCDNNFSMEHCHKGAEKCIDNIQDYARECANVLSESFPLAGAEKGARARLVSFESDNGIELKLSELGITPGSLIEVENVSPETGDIDIGVRGYHITIRKTDAEKLKVSFY
ncbi:MAG: metal-dependent transcriptional regulator [Thermodesulfobacteriota bacterium]|nr:metal-dependent transcriptional regulator [Thermodesulfobacteriota bacterium]